MPKSLTFEGRYSLDGKPREFHAGMGKYVAQSFAGKRVRITFTEITTPVSDSLRKAFFGHYLPAWMEVYNMYDGWDLNPNIGDDRTKARHKILAWFHEDIKLERRSSGGHQVKFPSFAEMDMHDVLIVIQRVNKFIEENYGLVIPDPDPDYKNKGKISGKFKP